MTLTVTNSPSVRFYKAVETYVVNAWIARAQQSIVDLGKKLIGIQQPTNTDIAPFVGIMTFALGLRYLGIV